MKRGLAALLSVSLALVGPWASALAADLAKSRPTPSGVPVVPGLAPFFIDSGLRVDTSGPGSSVITGFPAQTLETGILSGPGSVSAVPAQAGQEYVLINETQPQGQAPAAVSDRREISGAIGDPERVQAASGQVAGHAVAQDQDSRAPPEEAVERVGEGLRRAGSLVRAVVDPFVGTGVAPEVEHAGPSVNGKPSANGRHSGLGKKPQSVAELDLAPIAGKTYFPGPEDGDPHSIYSVVLDRFALDGKPNVVGDPAAADTRHGGNLRGLINQLDFIAGMGFKELLLTPVLGNVPEGYHGYWPINFLDVDPNLGTMDDFKELVREAHGRGMRVILDMVFNHTGPVFEYEGGHQFGPNPKKIIKRKATLVPAELNDESHFHRRGSIDNYHDPEQVKWGDFPGGLNHLATDRPQTQDILITIAKWWIRETDVDGFRLDTFQHVDPGFWKRFFPEIRAYAAGLGKKNFVLFGEVFHGDPEVLIGHMGREGLDWAYDYPTYFQGVRDAKANPDGHETEEFPKALYGVGATGDLETSFREILKVFGFDGMRRLVKFVDLQDKPRFLREADPAGVLIAALVWLFGSIGIPYVYYGTEEFLRRAPGNVSLDYFREDKFPEGKFRNPTANGDPYSKFSRVYRLLAQLNQVRQKLAAISRGRQEPRWRTDEGPGLYAFSRIHKGHEVLVVINTSGQTQRASMALGKDSIPGTELIDELGSNYEAVVYPGPKETPTVDIEVQAHGALIMNPYKGRLGGQRERHKALALGTRHLRFSDPGFGLRAFSYIHEEGDGPSKRGVEVVVLHNSAQESREATFWVDASISPPGTKFVDALDGSRHPYSVWANAIDGGSKLSVSVPPGGMRLLVRQGAPH